MKFRGNFREKKSENFREKKTTAPDFGISALRRGRGAAAARIGA